MPGAIIRPAAVQGPAARSRAAGALALLFAGVAGCNSARAAGALETLHGSVLGDTMVLALPVGIAADGGRVVVQDALPPPAVRVLSADGHPLGSAGRQGAGPGEFAQPLDVFPRPGHPGELWVFDPRLARLTPLLLASDGRPELGVSVALANPVVVESPRWLDESTLVALNGMLTAGERRFSLYAADGTPRGSVGEPPPGNSEIRAFIRQQAYGGKIAVHPNRAIFVLASRYAGRLESYDRAGRLLRRFQVPDEFEPDFSPAPDGINMVRGRAFRFGYIDVTADSRRVYALFSGSKKHDPNPNFAQQVHMFDWDGKLVKVLRLDQPAFRIAVDAAGRYLYAVRLEPEPRLVRYDLREVSE